MVQPREELVGSTLNGSQERDEREPSPSQPDCDGEPQPQMGRRPSNSRGQLRWQLSRQVSQTRLSTHALYVQAN